jgi:hypothetical protein
MIWQMARTTGRLTGGRAALHICCRHRSPGPGLEIWAAPIPGLLRDVARHDVEIFEHPPARDATRDRCENEQLAAAARRVHGKPQRAPLPMNTTSAVCTRIARSNNRLLFFT